MPGIRLVDPAVVAPTFKQLQQIKSYYAVPRRRSTSTATRSTASSRDTVIAVRELDLNGSPPGSATGSTTTPSTPTASASWPRTATSATTTASRSSIEQDIPPMRRAGRRTSRASTSASSRRTTPSSGAPSAAPQRARLPGHQRDRAAEHDVHRRRAGCASASFARKAAYAIKYQRAEHPALGRGQRRSRILYDRKPRERVEKVAPWLTLDGDPYPAVVRRPGAVDPRRVHDVRPLPVLAAARRSTARRPTP